MRNSATHTNGKDLANQIALLRSQLEDLAETVNGTKSSLIGRGEEILEDALQSARDTIAKYGDSAKSMAHDAREKASAKLVEHTEAHPFATVAAIVGVGFLAGWLFRRR
jgi:ElaB/YqjD/DUF883 family membrane-anchored ribosome-binding protein